jgi:serine phosphatase RsbU (regulator of sigma subunit)/anti-sigma regulatory factor (Ser/Thr protein kinase)
MSVLSRRAHHSFSAQASSVAEARRFTRAKLQEWGASDLLDTAALIVSELVTNAVVHTGTAARLDLRLEARDLRVEVEDRHPGRMVPMAPVEPSEDLEHGRGLMITTSIASAWGVEYTSTTKRVWAVCERPGLPGPRPLGPPGTADHDRARVAVVQVSPAGEVTAWNDDAHRLFGWPSAEIAGRPLRDLVEPVSGEAPPPDEKAFTGAITWQGTYAVLCQDGTAATVFASHVPAAVDDGGVVLLVPAEQRELLEHPRPAPVTGTTSTPLGLRDDALLRLEVGEYLTLAVERVRDAISADSVFLLLTRDFDEELEVCAVSGLPGSLRGERLPPGAPGTPDPHNPHLPVVVHDLAETPVPLLEETGLRSLVVVPVVVEGRVIGALGAASERAEGFTDEQASELQRYSDSLAIGADRARLQSSERERRGWLSYVADAGDLLGGSLDPERTMAITGQILVPRMATWCAIHLADSRGQEVLQQVWHEDERQVEALRAELERLGPGGDGGEDEGMPGYAVARIPLVARGHTIGQLTLGRPPGSLRGSDFHLVVESVARRAALAIDNARAHGELRAVGRALQESLLPPSVPTVPGLDVGVVYEPADETAAAGGDFYDLFAVEGGRWCFVVGDVCGAGAEAAAVTGLARHTLRALTRAGFPIAAALERLNTAILEEGERGRFLTLVCGTLRRENGRTYLSLVSAGHPPPFLVTPDGAVREIGNPQSLLGVVENAGYAAEEHILHHGDLLVALPDGVLERRRDPAHMRGADGVAEELAHAVRLPAQAVAERLRRRVVEFADDPPHDDMAILVLRMETGTGSSAPSP